MAHWRLQKDQYSRKTSDSTRSNPPRVPETWRGYRKEAEVFILRDSYKGDKVDGCNHKGKSFKKSFLFMCVSDCGFVQGSAVSSEVRSESISPLELVIKVVLSLHLWLLGAKSGLLKEQCYLSTANQGL